MARELSQRQIETAKRVIRAEKSHRLENGNTKKHHDLYNRKIRVKEMEFLEKLITRLWVERNKYKDQGSLFTKQ